MDHDDTDHEDTASHEHEDEDKHMHVDEIVIAALVLSAPPEILAVLVDRMRAEVSIIAAEKALELVMEIKKLGSVDALFAAAKEKLCPELVGPTGERTVYLASEFLKKIFEKVEKGEIPMTVARMNDKGEIHEMDMDSLDPNAFAELTPNCGCPRCRKIKDLESRGLRLKNNGTTVPFDRLN